MFSFQSTNIFTQGLLERNELRNKALGISNNSTNQQSNAVDKENKVQNLTKKNDSMVSKTASPKKSSQISINNQQLAQCDAKTPIKVTRSISNKQDPDVAVEINIASTQNIQVEVEVAECEFDDNGKMVRKGETVSSLTNYDCNSAAQLRDSSRKNLKRLGALYSETHQISSPIQRTEEKFCEESSKTGSRPLKKFSKLTELANDINTWDDDYSHHTFKDNNGKSPKKQTAVGSPAKTTTLSKKTPNSPAKKLPASPVRKDSVKSTSDQSTTSTSTQKKLLWDKKVIDSLEAQGFARRESTGPKLVYDYANKCQPSTSGMSSPKKAPSFVKPAQVSSPAKKDPPKATTSQESLKSKSVRFSSNFAKNQKDPAEMSLKERMAIFEKNKGKAPVPNTPFGITDANPFRANMNELSRKFDFGFKTKSTTPSVESTQSSVPEKSAVNIKHTVNKLILERPTTISEQQISNEIRKQKEKDMMCILNRFNMPRETDGEDIKVDERKRRSDEKPSSHTVEESDELKRARISNPPRLYPVLSDIEHTTDSEVDNYTTATVSESEDQGTSDSPKRKSSDMSDDESEENELNLSIGREILNSVRKSIDLSNNSYLESSVTSSEISGAINDMDNYLDEALDDENDSKDYDDKGSACSDSFEYERYPKRVSFKKDHEIPIKSKIEISPAENVNGSIQLVHTVSFYRRQQSASANNTPVKKVVHKNAEEEREERTSNVQVSRKAREECDNKIKRLLDEVMRQQTIISQTSQALNLCASTIEFSGSTEAVEGERHLLVATHRRLACLNEVQRLKVEGLVDRFGAAREKGTLSIQEVIIPLKSTYISRLATDEINGHHLLCLVKYNEFVLATKTLPTLPGLKSVKFTDLLTFNEVYADFKVNCHFFLNLIFFLIIFF
jgi:actin-binding protein anillin